jgi:hypothetical protein
MYFIFDENAPHDDSRVAYPARLRNSKNIGTPPALKAYSFPQARAYARLNVM